MVERRGGAAVIAAVDWTAWLLLGLVLLVAIGVPVSWPRLVA